MAHTNGHPFPTAARHSISIKIERDDDEDPVVVSITEMSPPPVTPQQPAAAAHASDQPVIQTVDELKQYWDRVPSLSPAGGFVCPINGCRIKRYLHFREHLFGRPNRIAVCGPLRPANKKRRIKSEPAEAVVDLNQSQTQSLFPHPQQQLQQQQQPIRSPPKKRQSLPSRLLASPNANEAIDLSKAQADDVVWQSPVNGHHQESDAQFVRRSTRVKKEPVDVYEAEIPASVMRKRSSSGKGKKRNSHRNPAVFAENVATGSLVTSSSVSATILVNQATQTDLTIFQMSFMNIKDKNKKKKT